MTPKGGVARLVQCFCRGLRFPAWQVISQCSPNSQRLVQQLTDFHGSLHEPQQQMASVLDLDDDNKQKAAQFPVEQIVQWVRVDCHNLHRIFGHTGTLSNQNCCFTGEGCIISSLQKEEIHMVDLCYQAISSVLGGHVAHLWCFLGYFEAPELPPVGRELSTAKLPKHWSQSIHISRKAARVVHDLLRRTPGQRRSIRHCNNPYPKGRPYSIIAIERNLTYYFLHESRLKCGLQSGQCHWPEQICEQSDSAFGACCKRL